MIDPLTLGLNIVQVSALVFSIAMIVRWLRNRGNSVVLGFLLYAYVCILISDIYWNAMLILKPELRIPFAASEIADMGAFLFLAAMLGEIFRNYRLKLGWETVLTAIHGVISVVFWTAWAGEWFKNIIGGIPFIYYLFIVVWSSKKIQAFTKTEKIWIAVGIYVLNVLQGIGLLVSSLTDIMNYISYVIIGIGFALLGAKTYRTIRKAFREESSELARKALALSLITLVWTQNGMYMSNEPFYSIEDVGFTVCVLLILYSVFAIHKNSPDDEAEWGMI
ncbi:MAG: hypothetical protein J5643_08810 [Lachnospiraceae bacterium]|nr:hypothetical protein [Lachnospiraceae bacterium]